MESSENVMELLQSLHKKIDIVMQQNAAILALHEKKLQGKLQNRRNSSRRGLGRKDIETQLKNEPPPSLGFFDWVDTVQRGMDSGFVDLLCSVDKFEVAVFRLLQGAYLVSGSPIFSIKMDKNNYIYDSGAFRLMNQGDMKRIMLLFQCRGSLILDDWYRVLVPGGDSDDESSSDKSGTELHFNKRKYDAEVDKVNRLCLNDGNSLRTLLRKFNTYMLEARGIVFEGRRRAARSATV